MVSTATAAQTATMQFTAVSATDTAAASVVLAKDRATDCAVNQEYSSATHDNVAISSASTAATTTTTTSKHSAPITTFNNNNSTSTTTNTRMSAAATQLEKSKL
uniref:Uncharacterized protein n=1 Tax=Bactrocera dorsalis TaxID=27457 RepID=A0A034WRY8_BACDO